MKTTIITVVAVVAVLAVSCGQIGDARYDKWQRYTDQDDKYVLLIPPGWNASDEVLPGFRGTRFAPIEDYTGDIAAFVYYAVMVKDLENPDVDFATASEATLREMLTGIWTDLKLTSKAGQFAGESALIYETKGKPLYTDYTLKGETYAVKHDGKLYLFMISATDGSFEGLSEEFSLINNSVQFVQEP